MESEGIAETKRPEQIVEPAPGAQTGPRNGNACCEPECSCVSASAGKGVRIVISLLALALVMGIVLYKVSAAKTAVAVSPSVVFPVAPTASNASPVASEPSPGSLSSRTPVASSGRIGEYLKSLKDLDTMTPIRDAIFVYIPAGRNETIPDQTIAAVLSAQQVFDRNHMTLGLYTLRFESPDYAGLSHITTTPAVLVRTKGRKTTFVSEDITELKLLQAFTALSRGGGCCPPAK